MLRKTSINLAILLIFILPSCKNMESKCCVPPTSNLTSTTSEMKPDTTVFDNKLNFGTDVPLVCQLSGPEQVARKDELRKHVFSQIKKEEELELGYRLYFDYDVDFMLQLMDYVLAENSCCPFLAFDIQLHAQNDATLSITGPNLEAKKIIETVLKEDRE